MEETAPFWTNKSTDLFNSREDKEEDKVEDVLIIKTNPAHSHMHRIESTSLQSRVQTRTMTTQIKNYLPLAQLEPFLWSRSNNCKSSKPIAPGSLIHAPLAISIMIEAYSSIQEPRASTLGQVQGRLFGKKRLALYPFQLQTATQLNYTMWPWLQDVIRTWSLLVNSKKMESHTMITQ